MNLSSKAKEVLDYISLMFYGINKFKIYINSLKYKLNFFEEIDKEIPSNLTNIYNKIKTTKKYFSYYKKYEELKLNIEEHNHKVSNVKNIILKTNVSKWLNNPYAIDEKELQNTYEVSLYLNNFNKLDSKYADFKEKVIDINNNLNIIKEQFDNLNKAKIIINKYLDLDAFLDFYYNEDLKLELKDIFDIINNSTKLYYDFSFVNSLKKDIKEHNKKYIDTNINNEIFNDVNGKTLDFEQRKAILNSEIANLVIAGAGSGKTLTICGKVKYLLEHDKISPNDILLLSYSKKSVLDLNEKIKHISPEINVSTFHKLGLDILKSVYNKSFLVEEQYDAIIEKYFRDELIKKRDILNNVFLFLTLYYKSNFNVKKYNDIGEEYEELINENYTTLKDLLSDVSRSNNKRTTLKKELVRSDQELILANFYFINGINYEYEKPYKIDASTQNKKQYTPDFYLVDYDIYHEHYGIDEFGKCKQYNATDEAKYLESMKWKRETHELNQTKCIETYSYEFNNGTIFSKLEETLKANGVVFNKISTDQMVNILNSKYYGLNMKSFINLVKTFVSLYKAQYENELAFSNIYEELKKLTKYQRTRAKLFLAIAKDVYLYYSNHIRLDNKIDFDDMILKSIEALKNTKDFNYKYIIVDEFQDISQSRFSLLKSLLKHGNSRLLAVGDDWQAIYRFSGCDINIFLNFSKLFRHNTINYITTTYRNSQELQDIAANFIMANSEQYNKEIKSDKHLTEPIKVIYYDNNKTKVFNNILENIYKKDNHANILVLGRNNHDLKTILNDKLILISHNNLYSSIYSSLNLKYSTVHSAKGLESDYVILINAKNADLGFPNKLEDDALLNLVLKSSSSFPYSEERRLWYVALTRTKTFTYIMCDYYNPSIFVDEIKEKVIEVDKYLDSHKEKAHKCPRCKSGNLVIRTDSNGSKFYGCSNFPYCDYTLHDLNALERNMRCPYCNDYLVWRNGKYGAFYGCNSFPKCIYTKAIDVVNRNFFKNCKKH